MPLTINPSPVTGSFASFTYDFIRKSEGLYKRIYTDGLGVPTLGVGYALATRSAGRWSLRPDYETQLALVGITLNEGDRGRLAGVVTALNDNNNVSLAKALIPPAPSGVESDAASTLNNRFSFGLINEGQARTLFDNVIPFYTKRVTDRLGIAASSPFNTSAEMAALISVSYNGPALIGNKLVEAFKKNDRAGVWFEIRYGSNGGVTDRGGLANRHYRESDLFGLYNDIGNISEEEARNVLAMFTTRRTDILNYETDFNPANSLAQSLPIIDKLVFADRQLIQKYVTDAGIATDIAEASGAVRVGGESLQRTTTFSGTSLGDTNNPTGNDLLLGAKTRANRIDGKSGNDIIYGGDDSDQLTGGDGADTLIGGKGYDILDGGNGSDTYIIKAGEGTDVILDSDGQGIIKYTKADGSLLDITGGTSINGNDENGTPLSGIWESEDHSIRYTLVAGEAGRTDLVVNFLNEPAGSGSLLIKNFNRNGNQLGIELAEGTAPSPHTNVSGASTNDNSDLSSANPANSSTLHDEGANQEILGLGGADKIVLSSSGGIGRGGDGNDTLIDVGTAEGNEAKQDFFGDTGNDVITAAKGNDKLYGGIGHDTLSGGADDDYMDGGEGNDFLDGGLGADILIGGAGSDYIIGGGSIIGSYDALKAVSNTMDVIVLDGEGNITTLPSLLGANFFPTNDDVSIAGDIGNVIDAGDGNDIVYGGSADDVVDAGADNDLVIGMAGSDTIRGGTGNDVLDGGVGLYAMNTNTRVGATFRAKISQTHQTRIAANDINNRRAA